MIHVQSHQSSKDNPDTMISEVQHDIKNVISQQHIRNVAHSDADANQREYIINANTEHTLEHAYGNTHNNDHNSLRHPSAASQVSLWHDGAFNLPSRIKPTPATETLSLHEVTKVILKHNEHRRHCYISTERHKNFFRAQSKDSSRVFLIPFAL